MYKVNRKGHAQSHSNKIKVSIGHKVVNKFIFSLFCFELNECVIMQMTETSSKLISRSLRRRLSRWRRVVCRT